jgi:hypothetical protein
VAERIIHFELEGKAALGFDTGLSAQAFAQAKLAQFITQEGVIVYADGKIEAWKPSAVIEHQRPDEAERPEDAPAQSPAPGVMVIWGPDFKGERFDLLFKDEARGELTAARQDQALDALRLWIEVRSAAKLSAENPTKFPANPVKLPAENPAQLSSGNPVLPLYPAGALVDLAANRILFPPERLVMRSLQAEGDDAWLDGAESLVNPELPVEDAEAFTAGAILYRILSGMPPFPNRDRDLLHQDIREGVFLPARLAAPGLDEKIAALVDQAIASSRNASEKKRPSLTEFGELLGPVHSRKARSFFRSLDEAEAAKLAEEKEQFQKKKELAVNTRRFVIRNISIITGICVAVLIAVLIARSIVVSQASLPTTAGMESAEVIQSYYGAFGDMDHTLMDACVIKKAGKGDIEMVTNLYVMSRVRQAYESSAGTSISAQQWIDSGAQPTESQVFGVSDLDIRKIRGDESSDEIRYRASFILWLPAQMGSPAGDNNAESIEDEPIDDFNMPRMEAELPKGYPFTDELTLIRHKGNWRIAEIVRESN